MPVTSPLSTSLTSAISESQMNSILGFANALSCMIFDARSESRRWMTVTFDANLRQVDRLLHRRVAAADDGDRLAAEEVAVAGRARRHAVARQLAVGADVEPARRRAGGDDQRLGRDRAALGQRDRERTLAEVDARDVALPRISVPNRSRLLPHLGHQVRPHDAVPEPGPVLHHRRQHQLTAGLEPLDEQRLQVGAGGVQRGGQPGRARPDDDDLPVSHRI